MTDQPKAAPSGKPWHVVLQGARSGPFSFDEISDLVTKDEVNPQTLAWKEGMRQWEPAKNLPELASLFEAPTPPPIPEYILPEGGEAPSSPGLIEGAENRRGPHAAPLTRPLLRPYEHEDSQIKTIMLAIGVSLVLVILAGIGVSWLYKASHNRESKKQEANVAVVADQPSENGVAPGAEPSEIPNVTPKSFDTKSAENGLQALSTRKIPLSEALQLGEQALAQKPSLKKKVAEAYLAQAKKHLQGTGKTDLSDGISLLQEATALNPEMSSQAGEQVWQQLSKRLYSPEGFNQSTFSKLYQLSQRFGVSSQTKQQPTYHLAQSLVEYQKGNKAKAVAALQTLASQSSDPAAMRFARRILSMPKIGTRVFQAQPYVMKDARGKDALIIMPASIHITKDTIQLSFRVRNVNDQKQGLLYGRKPPEQSYGNSNGPLSIEDDLGKSFFSTQGFVGGKQRIYDQNSDLWLIEFEPGEDTRLTADFPMISPGASQIKFVSPEYGGQTSWWWSNIRVKEDPFEPPLKPVLVADKDNVKPSLEPASVSPTFSPSAEPPAVVPSPEASPTNPVNVDDSLPDLNQNPPNTVSSPTPVDSEYPESYRDQTDSEKSIDSQEPKVLQNPPEDSKDSRDAQDESEDTAAADRTEESGEPYANYRNDELSERQVEQPDRIDIRDLDRYRDDARRQRERFLMLRIPPTNRLRYASFARGEQFFRMANDARNRRNYIAATAYYKESARAYHAAAR